MSAWGSGIRSLFSQVRQFNWQKHLLNVSAAFFKPRRQFERFAKVFDGFIEYESRWVGGNFKKSATRLTEIDGVEISPIEHGCDVQWYFRKHFAPLKLCAVIRRPECDVMYGSSTHVSVDKLRLNEDIDAVPWCSRGRDKPNTIVFLTSLRETHLFEYLRGQFETGFTECDSIESPNRVLRRNIACARRSDR